MGRGDSERRMRLVEVDLAVAERAGDLVARDLGSARMATAVWAGARPSAEGADGAEELQEIARGLAKELAGRLEARGMGKRWSLVPMNGQTVYLHMFAPDGLSGEEALERAREELERAGEDLGLSRAPARLEGLGALEGKFPRRGGAAQMEDWGLAQAALRSREERGELGGAARAARAEKPKRGGL